MISFEIQQRIEKRFDTWYHSFPNRLRRAVAFLIGGELVFSVLNNPFKVGVSIGWLHGGFNGFLAVHHMQVDKPMDVLFAIGAQCGQFGITIMNKEVTGDTYECEACFELNRASQEVYNNILQEEIAAYIERENTKPNDEEHTQPVERPKPPTPGDSDGAVTPKPGAMTAWMGVN